MDGHRVCVANLYTSMILTLYNHLLYYIPTLGKIYSCLVDFSIAMRTIVNHRINNISTIMCNVQKYYQ